jgi:hypothetical protein
MIQRFENATDRPLKVRVGGSDHTLEPGTSMDLAAPVPQDWVIYGDDGAITVVDYPPAKYADRPDR